MGGKEVLIKAVAQAIPAYTMSCFQLLQSLCDDLESMMRNFWWGQKQSETKMYWVSWKRMCFSKADGGMGFRNFKAFNQAMLAKQAWRILSNPSSLVTRVLKSKYFPTGDVLNAKLGSLPSYSWRSIHGNLEVIRRGSRWRVGNGKLIHIWEDRWLPTPSTYKGISLPNNNPKFPMVFAFINPLTKWWNVSLVKTSFLPFEVDSILRIPLSYSMPEDKLIWLGNKRGEFTVKSAYYIAFNLLETKKGGECSSRDPYKSLWKRLWHLNLLAKVKIFAWRACINGLPTMDAICIRGISNNRGCLICKKDP